MTTPTRDGACGQRTGTAYRIRVSGILGEEWSRRTHGMTVATHRSQAEGNYTELIGVLQDEAALMGVLDVLYSHGARLLSVEHVNDFDPSIVNPADSL